MFESIFHFNTGTPTLFQVSGCYVAVKKTYILLQNLCFALNQFFNIINLECHNGVFLSVETAYAFLKPC